jgi:hypothetical protein
MKLCSTRLGHLWLEAAGSGPQQAEGELPDKKGIYSSRLQSLVHIHKLVVVLTEGLVSSAVRMILIGHRGIDDVLWLAVATRCFCRTLLREERTKHWIIMTPIRAQKTARVARTPGI